MRRPPRPGHRPTMLLLAGISLVGLSSCGSPDEERDSLAQDAGHDAGPADAAPIKKGDAGPPGPVASNCPADQFGIGLSDQGILLCGAIDATAKAAVNESCSLFMGWRDSCDGCASDPIKWGQVNSQSCTNGAGANNTCSTATLGGPSVQLFGLNTDGDVDGGDKFYMGFRCEIAADTPSTAESHCADNGFLSGIRSDGVDCTDAHLAISQYAQDSCKLYFGWRDGCDGCTNSPTKVGSVQSLGCSSGGGTNSTCSNTTIAGGLLDLLGINTDGDVDGGDKFYVGFQCSGAVAQFDSVATNCPPGSLVTAILADGSLECTNLSTQAEAAIQSDCHVYYGWRDSCDGCATEPAKWGRVSSSACENGIGTDNTCGTHDVAGQSVTMFGLNTDGDVNDDDKFYAGFQCE